MPRPSSSASVEPRDRAILEHIARYRLTVPRALEAMPYFADRGPTAVGNVLARLRTRGWIRSAPLYADATGRYRYYHLTGAGAGLLGLSRKAAQPLSDDPKIRAYAILCFCCLAARRRQLFTPAEFRRQFPGHARRGEPLNYYLDTDGPVARLGYLRVDFAGRGRWDRLIGSCQDDLGKRKVLPAFRATIEDGRFVITILTALERKAERLREAFVDRGLDDRLQVHVVPELLPLVAPQPLP